VREEIIERLVPGVSMSVADVEKRYPPRPDGMVVTRIAPSPTGYMHIGTLWTAMTDERFAHQNGGVFYLRIEDTDQKRLVREGIDAILRTLDYCDLRNDEGLRLDGKEYGDYGPYTQSDRRDIYKVYVKEFLRRGLAYPSFMTHDELEKIREEQTKLKIRTGLYGLWAKERTLTESQIVDNLDAGKPYVIYFKSNGNFNNRFVTEDLIKGKRMLPENDLDIVILKSDGLPTYHFAHLVDDHLMGTTHVFRTDEWFVSTPLHIQLFQAIGWKVPHYVQPAPICKLDNGAKRKLSKRKDLEANFQYYIEKGYPKEVIMDYLMNLANSNYEDWKKQNPKASFKEFNFDIKKLGVSGALFDFKKLDNITKDFMASITAEELYKRLLSWAEMFDNSLAQKMKQNRSKFIAIFEIERKNTDRVRKDYGVLSDIYNEIEYFFDFSYNLDTSGIDMTLVSDYAKSYNDKATKDEWFDHIKQMAVKYNYALNSKEFDKNIHKGTLSDFVGIFRYLITGRKNSPDLYAIMKILGKDEVMKRLKT